MMQPLVGDFLDQKIAILHSIILLYFNMMILLVGSTQAAILSATYHDTSSTAMSFSIFQFPYLPECYEVLPNRP